MPNRLSNCQHTVELAHKPFLCIREPHPQYPAHHVMVKKARLHDIMHEEKDSSRADYASLIIGVLILSYLSLYFLWKATDPT